MKLVAELENLFPHLEKKKGEEKKRLNLKKVLILLAKGKTVENVRIVSKRNFSIILKS